VWREQLMVDFKTLSNGYLALGAGGVALVVILWLIIYFVTKINPALQSIKEEAKANAEVIKNNTQAIKEVSKSNENVATALALLETSFNTFSKLMEKHDTRAEDMSRDIIRIDQKISNIDSKINKGE
jgi:chromosome segregation ATPase